MIQILIKSQINIDKFPQLLINYSQLDNFHKKAKFHKYGKPGENGTIQHSNISNILFSNGLVTINTRSK